MLVISCSTKLQALETLLKKNLPESLKVYGAIMTINRGNPFRDEVVVDSWPNFQAVVTRPQRKYLLDPFNYYRNAYSAFYNDLDKYRDLLETMDVVNNDHAFQLHGHQEGVYQVSQTIADLRGVHLNPIRFLTVQHLNPMDLKDVKLKTDQTVRLSKLEDFHVDLINRSWVFGGTEKSRRYLGDLVHHFPSSCLLDEEGKLLSWAMTDQFATMSHSFTMAGHRQKGYNQLVMTTLGQRLQSLGYPLNGSVLQDNVSSKEMLASLGFSFLPCPCFKLIHSPNMSTAISH